MRLTDASYNFRGVGVWGQRTFLGKSRTNESRTAATET